MKKQTKNVIIGFMFILCFITLLDINTVSASLGSFEQGDCVNIKTILNSTYVNISSLSFPNSTIALTNQQMTKSGYSFNYSFCNTSTLGIYIYDYFDDQGNVYVNDFEITQTGYKQTTSEAIGSAVFLFLILALTVLFGFLGFKFVESDTLWVLGIFFIVLSLFFVVYDVWLGYEYHLNYIGSANNSALPQTIFFIFLTVLVAGLMVSLVLLITKWQKLVRWIKQALKEEKDEDDDNWDHGNFDKQ